VSTKPDAVVSFGLSAKAMGVTLESTARNRVSTGRPDFTGACASSDQISAGAAAIFPTRLPLREISVALAEHGVRLARSDDAGDYICNLLFYRLMEFAESGGPRVAGFVHVPYVESQGARLSAAGLTFDGITLGDGELMRGVKCIVSAVADALVTQKPTS
jgi:pyroglutamyl-peptidase